MEGFQHSPGLDAEVINPITPLSVEAFLYSLARTPTPTRFDRRRQRLLLGKPRLSRTRAYADQNANRASRSGTMPVQYAHVSEGGTVGTRLPSDDHNGQEASESSQNSLTLEQTIRIARLTLLNPVNSKDEPQDRPILSKYTGLESSSPGHGEQDLKEAPTGGHLEHASVASQDDLLLPPWRGLRRRARKQPPGKEYVQYRKPLVHQKSQKQPRIPRRLPVDELEFVADQVLTNISSDSDGKLICISQTVCTISQSPVAKFHVPVSRLYYQRIITHFCDHRNASFMQAVKN
jgi:hypothetical protein